MKEESKKAASKKDATPKKKKTVVTLGTKTKPKKNKDKTVDYTAEYSIEHNVKEGEADLHFDLANPTEDRFFAYSLTLMDLYQTLEGIKKVAPKEVVEDFITALKVLKGMGESIKLKVEIEAGLISSEDADKIVNAIDDEEDSSEVAKKKERIRKMLKTIKEKLQAKHPGAKVVIGRVPGSGSGNGRGHSSMEDALKEAMEQISKEMNDENEDDGKSSKGKKNTKLVRENIVDKRGRAEDLEV